MNGPLLFWNSLCFIWSFLFRSQHRPQEYNAKAEQKTGQKCYFCCSPFVYFSIFEIIFIFISTQLQKFVFEQRNLISFKFLIYCIFVNQTLVSLCLWRVAWRENKAFQQTQFMIKSPSSRLIDLLPTLFKANYKSPCKVVVNAGGKESHTKSPSIAALN